MFCLVNKGICRFRQHGSTDDSGTMQRRIDVNSEDRQRLSQTLDSAVKLTIPLTARTPRKLAASLSPGNGNISLVHVVLIFIIFILFYMRNPMNSISPKIHTYL